MSLVLVLLPTAARATPSEAAGLGGLDLNWPDSMDTFQYFETDLNLFVNPALAHRYRDQVQVNLGFAGGGLFEGSGQNPRGLLLAGTESFTLGFALNRDPAELGENAALGNTLDLLMLGSTTPGVVGGGTFSDPVTLAGLSGGRQAVPLEPPIDLFAAFAAGPVTIGINAFAAFGQSRTDSESAVADPDDDWTRVRTLARSSWVTLRAGAAINDGTGGVVPEGWLHYTGVSSWFDTQSWGPEERGEWDDQDLLADETVGLKGTGRIGGGVRVTLPVSDAVDLIPALQVDNAGGRTFSTFRLANEEDDPDEAPFLQAEDDLLRVVSWSVRVGTGVTWRPQEELEVVATASAHLDTTTVTFDNNAQLLEVAGTARVRTAAGGMSYAVPVVSIGAEYAFAEPFAVRAGIRSTTLLDRDTTSSVFGVGPEDDDWVIDETSRSFSGSDAGDLPPLTVALGPSVRLDAATIDAVVGGGMLGSGTDLFSRIDAVFRW